MRYYEKRLAAIIGFLALLAFAPMPLSAQSNVADIVFSEVEKRIIKQFYQSLGVARPGYAYGKDVKRGKKNKGRSRARAAARARHPGWPGAAACRPGSPGANNCPPGLSKSPLPRELRAKLPAAARGTERAVVDGNIVLIQVGVNILLDVLEDVLTQ